MQANIAPAPADKLEEELSEGKTGKMHTKYISFLESMSCLWHENKAVLSPQGCWP